MINARALLGFLLLGAAASEGQAPRRAHEIPSLGQPSRWESFAVPGSGRSEDGVWRGALTVGLHRHHFNPILGLLGLRGEVYGTVDPGVEPGARLFATVPVLGLSAGLDWDGRARSLDRVYSVQAALRRGGIEGHGTMLRVDWVPSRDHALNVGLHVPFTALAGRTRPFDTDVAPPAAPRTSLAAGAVPANAEVALRQVSDAASMVLAYTNLYPESGTLNYGPSYAAAIRLYGDGLAEAFRVAAGNTLLGDRVVRRARDGVFDDVILPFDSLFGRVKEDSRSIRPLTSRAQSRFMTWLRDSSRASPAAQPAILAVHARWLSVIERVHRDVLKTAHDSRLVWMPLQLALTEDQYDEQAEVDALIARAVGRPFTDENALSYLRSSDLPLEIARSVFAARDYHVLWTHDFPGVRDETKALDEMSYSMVADVYLPALTAAVQRYDSLRAMPVYLLMIDAFYYEQRRARVWMDILENPLQARIALPGHNPEKEAHLRMRQDELRAAVAKSWRLQQDATANGGARWLPGVVKVNVNVLHPSDFSFRSDKILPPWPIVPDNIMRDHRKIVFYDLKESSPYRGALMVMGVGIGEHYASPTWEDRGYRMRGPAALEVRAAARRALVSSGMKERDLPFVLRPDAGQPVADGRVPEYVGRALQVHNETGFGEKKASVARAMLYNLAPPGSVIIVPDPLWVSDTWAAMLASAAARGCRVMIISPAHENNPNAHPPIEAVQHDVMTRLIDSRDRMRDQMRQTGGELRIGVFTGRTPVTDVAGRLAEIRQGLRGAPWIREVIPFDDATLSVLDRAVVATESDGSNATNIAKDESPRAQQLHQKSQLIARPGAIASLVRQPGWDRALARAFEAQSQQTAKFGDQLGYTDPEVDTTATRATDVMLRGFEQSLSDAERTAVSFYFSLGTQNQDPRGIMLDGEATIIVSGIHAAAGLVDLFYLMARSTWVESRSDFEAVVPKPKGLMAKLGRLVRYAL